MADGTGRGFEVDPALLDQDAGGLGVPALAGAFSDSRAAGGHAGGRDVRGRGRGAAAPTTAGRHAALGRVPAPDRHGDDGRVRGLYLVGAGAGGDDEAELVRYGYSGGALTDPLGLSPCPTGLKNASQGLKWLFSDGSVRGRSIISIRSELLDDGFSQELAANRSGYLFEINWESKCG